MKFIPIIVGITCIYNKTLKNKLKEKIKIDQIQGEVVKSSVQILKRPQTMKT